MGIILQSRDTDNIEGKVQTNKTKIIRKKTETEWTASVLKKRSNSHNRWKECFLTGRNRTKRANFRGSPLFQATYNVKTEKQTNNLTYLASVRWSEGGGRKRPRDTRLENLHWIASEALQLSWEWRKSSISMEERNYYQALQEEWSETVQ